MSQDDKTFVGVNWGSTNFRAYLIGADGSAIDEYSAPSGVVTLDRDGMAATMNALAARWPNSGPVYASGMIGSNVGWKEVPYAEAPAGVADLAAAAVATEIGSVPVHIVPGITCRRSFDGEPDILRGEEIEMMGLAVLGTSDGWVALPGTHTKWARLERGRVVEFFTSMSGEIFDRLTAKGLLASIVDGEAKDGPVFLKGVAAGRARKLSLGTLLFGARAQVVRGFLSKADAASYLRGLVDRLRDRRCHGRLSHRGRRRCSFDRQSRRLHVVRERAQRGRNRERDRRFTHRLLARLQSAARVASWLRAAHRPFDCSATPAP